MILIYPPITKATEPPAGISILSSTLKQHSIEHTVLDLNIEAQMFLLKRYFHNNPKKAHYLNLIQDEETYSNYNKYLRVVSELNRGLREESLYSDISLANITSNSINPLNSKDLKELVIHYKKDDFFDLYRERLNKIIENNNYQYIGISLQFINQIIPAFNLIGYIREYYPHLKIVLGGGLITSWNSLYDLNKIFSELDLIILPGRGEEEILKLFAIESSCIEYRADYSYIENYNYLSPVKILPVLTSYGCSWCRCRFCPELAEGNRYYSLNNNQFREGYKEFLNTYKPQLIHFIDNEISPNKLNVIKEFKGYNWYGFTKFNKCLESLDYCRELKESGCAMLKLGLESGDQQVLDDMKKGINLTAVSKILKNLNEVGIKTFIYILLGTPTEDRDSALKTKKFLKQHKECINFINIAIFNLPIINDLNLDVIPKEGDLSLYTDYLHPLNWDKRSIRNFIKDELLGDSDIKVIIQRTPKIFNANHAAFL